MKLQRLYSLTRQAIDHFGLIKSGDHIALGLSGGKDSLTLLYALWGLKQFYPKHFELSAITVDLGFADFNLTPAKELCKRLNVPLTVVSTEIGKILFHTRQEANPCALCAKLRKGALNETALNLGCNKIAYAHHQEDLIETMLLSLFYEGRFHAFSPSTYLDRTGLTIIRPMIFVKEADVISFKNRYQLPVCKNPCPVDGHTKREYVKNLTIILEGDNKGVKDRLFHAVLNGKIDGWPTT